MHGFPCRISVSGNPHKISCSIVLEGNGYLRSSSTSSSAWVSLRFSEYHGVRSLADGAKGTPLSVSEGSAFLVALMAAAIAFC